MFWTLCAAILVSLCAPLVAIKLRAQTSVVIPSAGLTLGLVADQTYDIGFADGWMGSFVDTMLIERYHQNCDALDDDTDPIALAKIWSDCLASGQQMEQTWDKLSAGEKINYLKRIGVPFWKSGKGEPRRLSHGPKK